jgi:hypothetical protein
VVLVAAALLGAAPRAAAELAEALITLEDLGPVAASGGPSALPVRFALLPDGQLFVGGTSGLLAGRLDKREASALEKRASAVRKLKGLSSPVRLGPGAQAFRLRLGKGKVVDVQVQGDPEQAPPALAALARLVSDLAAFDHASLVPYAPAFFALRAREGTLPGGCRSWTWPLPLADAQAATQVVPAAAAAGWPTGGTPASVCAGDKRYVVVLRPLLPGETP